MLPVLRNSPIYPKDAFSAQPTPGQLPRTTWQQETYTRPNQSAPSRVTFRVVRCAYSSNTGHRRMLTPVRNVDTSYAQTQRGNTHAGNQHEQGQNTGSQLAVPGQPHFFQQLPLPRQWEAGDTSCGLSSKRWQGGAFTLFFLSQRDSLRDIIAKREQRA